MAISFLPSPSERMVNQFIHLQFTTAAIPVLSNRNLRECLCRYFRPTGLAFDAKGRLFMASEPTGEIFLIGQSDGSTVDSAMLEISAPRQHKLAESELPL
jgi:hypothetical protein